MKDERKIIIDPNKAANLNELVRSIAYEVGHARYSVPVDSSSRQAYITSYLRDEGAAMISNFRTRDEIISNGGPNIGISGNTANHSQYESIYKLYGDTPEAYDKIATIFGANEMARPVGATASIPYNDYYGNFYDKYYGP